MGSIIETIDNKNKQTKTHQILQVIDTDKSWITVYYKK